jgi:hypothetical protein
MNEQIIVTAISILFFVYVLPFLVLLVAIVCLFYGHFNAGAVLLVGDFPFLIRAVVGIVESVRK